MKLKDDSVNPEGISTALLFGIIVAGEVFREEGVDYVLTSLKDGVHSFKSLHYRGDAADIRIWGLKDSVKTAEKIRQRLNKHYDVIAESDHIHLEFQPRHP